ncbi:MAG: CpsD/CapB family tyrosine-protein kinase [Acidobacteriota bacterium]
MMRSKTLDKVSDAYARIVDSLLIARDSRSHQRWVITSTRTGDGTTTTALGIARALAARGIKGLLIDANSRNPSISQGLNDPSHPGLLEAIKGEHQASEVCQEGHAMGNFAVVAVGRKEAEPLELLTNPRIIELLGDFAGHYDVVVVDTPALDQGLAALTLAPHVDGCVLVVRSAKTGKRALQKARERIEKAGGKILGTVLNGSMRC